MTEDKRPQQALAQAVVVLRTLRGLSQAELAARSGLSDVYIRQIERGERDIGIGALEKLAKGLSCDAGELLRAGGRTAVAQLIGAAYGAATRAEQQAVLYVLSADGSAGAGRKQALLTLLAQELAQASAAPRRGRPPKQAPEPPAPPPPAERPRSQSKRSRKR